MTANPYLVSLLIVCVIFTIGMAALVLLFHKERAALMAQNRDLLNRLMARDFAQYTVGSNSMAANEKNLEDYIRPSPPEKEDGDGLGMSVV